VKKLGTLPFPLGGEGKKKKQLYRLLIPCCLYVVTTRGENDLLFSSPELEREKRGQFNIGRTQPLLPARSCGGGERFANSLLDGRKKVGADRSALLLKRKGRNFLNFQSSTEGEENPVRQRPSRFSWWQFEGRARGGPFYLTQRKRKTEETYLPRPTTLRKERRNLSFNERERRTVLGKGWSFLQTQAGSKRGIVKWCFLLKA